MTDKKTIATEIEMVGEEQVIVHWEDGHMSEFASGYLRSKCPCATCVNESGGHETPIKLGASLPLLAKKARAGVHAVNILPVGHYAVRIDWSDGHNTGIYSFEYLRSNCPCAECRAKASSG